MKKIKILFVATILTATSLISSASNATAPANTEKSNFSLIEKMPVNIIVKQTATLKDGRSVTIFYKKVAFPHPNIESMLAFQADGKFIFVTSL